MLVTTIEGVNAGAEASAARADVAATRRRLADAALARREWLDAPDREFLEQMLVRGTTPGEMAALTGQSRQNVGRRVRRLMDRLSSRAAAQVARRCWSWPQSRREVAVGYWLRGLSLRQIARRTGLTFHEAREHLTAVKGAIGEDSQ